MSTGQKAATVPGAVAAADVVLATVPGPAVVDVLSAAGGLGGKVIIDAANMMGTGRLSLRQLADSFPEGRWVRAFNTLQARVLAEENHRQPRWVLFLSGEETARPPWPPDPAARRSLAVVRRVRRQLPHHRDHRGQPSLAVQELRPDRPDRRT
jgi:hypothetical protein